MTSQSEETKGSIPFGEPTENDPFSQIQQPSLNETSPKDVADASVLFKGNEGAETDLFSSTQPSNTSAANFFDQQQVPSEAFFDHVGQTSSAKSQEYVSQQQPTSLVQAYEPDYNSYDQQTPEQTSTEQYIGQWQQFDPNVHYYYDEQNQLHYYDPNTNQEYDMSQYGYEYDPQYYSQEGYDPQYYSQEGYDPNAYAAVAGQDQSAQANAHQANLNQYESNAYSTATLETQQQQQPYSLGQESYGPNAHAATNPTENEQQQHPVQENYEPNMYALNATTGSESTQQYALPQQSYDPNAYTANEQQEQPTFVQDNFNQHMHVANPKDAQPLVQESYDPNAYIANPNGNQHFAQGSYDPNAYATDPKVGQASVQDAYSPNVYTANPQDSQPFAEESHNPDLHATNPEDVQFSVEESYDPNVYAADNNNNQSFVQEGYDLNIHDVKPNNNQTSAQNSYDPNAYAANPVDQQEKQPLYSSAQENHDLNVYATHSTEQQYSNEWAQSDNYNPDLYSIVPEHKKSQQQETSVVGNEPSVDVEYFNYQEQPYSTNDIAFNTSTNPEQQDPGTEGTEQKKSAGSDSEPAIDVEYFNYQEQPYSSSDVGFSVLSLNPEQQDLGIETPTAMIDLNSSPFTELNANQESESQFAEVQLAPVISHTPVNKPVTTASITEATQLNVVAFEKAESPTSDYPTVEQLNSYEPLGQTNHSQFEEVKFEPTSVYTPAPPAPPASRAVPPNRVSSPLGSMAPPKRVLSPSTARNMPPNRVSSPLGSMVSPERVFSPPVARAMSPNRVSSPFGSMAPPDRILSPPSFGRPSTDQSSARSSLELKSSFTDRVASPAFPLVSCPDPQCEGENKPKAKFCCECGRPLAGLSRSNTPFATFSSVSEQVQTNPLDDKRASMIESLKGFAGHSVLFDTNMTADEKKATLVSYIDGRINEFSNKEEARCLLWSIVRSLVEDNGALGESEQLDKSILDCLGPAKETSESTVLDQLEGLLLRGNREGACQFAMDHDMWDHALIVSQSVHNDLYKRVVASFMDRTLFFSDIQLKPQTTDDKKSLRILYSLFSGSNLVSQLTRNNADDEFPSSHTKESLKDWKFALSLALANRTDGNDEAVHDLGSALKQCELVDESLICYLLSPKASVFSGLDASITSVPYTDLDLLYIIDLFGFAMKDDTASIQVFKFVHAWWLADLDFEQESQHYRESIVNAIGSENHAPFIEKFKQISQQLLESPSDSVSSLLNKSTSDKLIEAIEEKFQAAGNYGGFEYGMSNDNYQANSTPFSYVQDTSYAPSEQPNVAADQGAYSYGYSYGETYEPASTTSYNPVNTTHQPPETNAPPIYQSNAEEPKEPSLHDDYADLGFGNSSIQKKKGISEEPTDEKKEEAPKEESKKEQEKGGGWGIFSLFSRKDTQATDEKKPVRANLGQESSFYYDENEKRWVNKLNDTKPEVATPPPPPKSMTPQPPKSMTPQPPSTTMSPPTSKPNSVPPRVSSAPVSAPFGSPSGTPPGFSTPPIGGKRTGAGGKKKPMRSRYVDVFNPPN